MACSHVLQIDLNEESAAMDGIAASIAGWNCKLWLSCGALIGASLAAACADGSRSAPELSAQRVQLVSAGSGSAGGAAPQAEAARGPRTKRWAQPAFLGGQLSGDARVVSLAVNAHGDALIGWAQTNRMGVSVASASYAAASGWRDVTVLPATVGEASEVHVALDDEGRGLLVWNEHENPASVTGLSAVWSVSNGYSDAHALLQFNPTVSTTYGPRFAGHADGRAIALWGYAAGRGVAIQAFRYAPDAGWGPLTELQRDPAPTGPVGIVEADVAMADQGTAFTTYAAAAAPWANRSTPASPAGAAQLMDAAESGEAATPRVAAGNDDALAIWTRHGEDRQETVVARYIRGSGWSEPTSLQSTQVNGDRIGFAEVSQARPVFVLRRPCAAFIRPQPQHTDVWASCLDGRRWERPARIDLAAPGSSRGLAVAADGAGNWVAVWSRSDGSSEHVYANRYANGRWSGATRLDADGGNSSDPTVSLDAQGNGFAAWTQMFGYARVLVSRLE